MFCEPSDTLTRHVVAMVTPAPPLRMHQQLHRVVGSLLQKPPSACFLSVAAVSLMRAASRRSLVFSDGSRIVFSPTGEASWRDGPLSTPTAASVETPFLFEGEAIPAWDGLDALKGHVTSRAQADATELFSLVDELLLGKANQYFTLVARCMAHCKDAEKWLMVLHGSARNVGKTLISELPVVFCAKLAVAVEKQHKHVFTHARGDAATSASVQRLYSRARYLTLDEVGSRGDQDFNQDNRPIDHARVRAWQSGSQPLYPPVTKLPASDCRVINNQLICITGNTTAPASIFSSMLSPDEDRLTLCIDFGSEAEPTCAARRERASQLRDLLQDPVAKARLATQFFALLINYARRPVAPDGSWTTLDTLRPTHANSDRLKQRVHDWCHEHATWFVASTGAELLRAEVWRAMNLELARGSRSRAPADAALDAFVEDTFEIQPALGRSGTYRYPGIKLVVGAARSVGPAAASAAAEGSDVGGGIGSGDDDSQDGGAAIGGDDPSSDDIVQHWAPMDHPPVDAPASSEGDSDAGAMEADAPAAAAGAMEADAPASAAEAMEADAPAAAAPWFPSAEFEAQRCCPDWYHNANCTYTHSVDAEGRDTRRLEHRCGGCGVLLASSPVHEDALQAMQHEPDSDEELELSSSSSS